MTWTWELALLAAAGVLLIVRLRQWRNRRRKRIIWRPSRMKKVLRWLRALWQPPPKQLPAVPVEELLADNPDEATPAGDDAWEETGGGITFEEPRDWEPGTDTEEDWGSVADSWEKPGSNLDNGEPDVASGQQPEFQPIWLDGVLNVTPETLHEHAALVDHERVGASPLLRACLLNNIACCFANDGDYRSAARVFKDAVAFIDGKQVSHSITLGHAAIEIVLELAERGNAEVVQEKDARLEKCLTNPADLALCNRPVIEILNDNLNAARNHISGR